MTMRVELIPHWRAAWRMLCVQANALNAAFLATWGLLPDNLRDKIPTPVVVGVAVGLLVVGTLGRLVVQPKVQQALEDSRRHRLGDSSRMGLDTKPQEQGKSGAGGPNGPGAG